MKEILDSEEINEPIKDEFNAGIKPYAYIITMFLGGLLYSKYFTAARNFDLSEVLFSILGASIGLIFISLIISFIFEFIGFLIRKFSGKKKKLPLWFTAIEGAFYIWVLFIVFALIGNYS